ncbi:MAG: protein jag [Firmicutes bacterium]|nr:protein jag [Bacillota bacterium]
MIKAVEITAKSISEAVEEGAAKLGVGLSDVDHTVLDEGSKGFLGLGARPARVKVFLLGCENEPTEQELKAKEEAERAAKEAAEKEAEKAEKAAKEAAEKEAKKAEKAAEKAEKKAETAVEEDTEETEKSERPPLTDADKANVIKVAENFLESVFATMNIKVDFNSEFVDNKQLVINMSGDEMGVVIGKRGQTLDSLQTLTSLVVNKGDHSYVNVTLDTESYRERRKETLERLAFNLAKKCKHNRRNVVLEPMNPYERRIIHSTLQNDRYVTTYSEGVEPHRYVVITMKNSYSKHQDKE